MLVNGIEYTYKENMTISMLVAELFADERFEKLNDLPKLFLVNGEYISPLDHENKVLLPTDAVVIRNLPMGG